MKLEKYKKAIEDCTKSIELDDKYVKAYYRRAQCYEATEKLDECLADYNKILELDPSHKEAQNATLRLPPLIEARNEKLKAEMLGSSGPWCHVDRLRSIVTPLSRSPSKRWSPSGKAALSLLEEI
ncbi:jg14092 [Pararge aegeria aegeria]|uniref:Jg14092 protein n=1 Tax=Pararge aegeria aegeria TaxID=348720 RepID=A0A8S4RM55_9NEOP|nr:jg14092 [Pararge aegeria aegeria]